MKKIFTFIVTALVVTGTIHATFVSPGTGKTYTFADLAKITTSGVVELNNAYVVSRDFTIAPGDTLAIQNGDLIQLADGVTITVNGFADFAPSDTAHVTSDSPESMPKGFKFSHDNAGAKLAHVAFDYVGFSLGHANGTFIAQNCSFSHYNAAMSSSATINFYISCSGNVIQNCRFIEGQTAAIASGANIPVGITISGNYFYHNNTRNTNRPQINLTCAGDNDVEISHNTIIGGQFTKVGGIGVSNMLGMDFQGKTTIKDNRIEDNRYGIALTGGMNLEIIGNHLLNNKYETNPNMGGSGISLYDSNGAANVYIQGNHIENSLWGITVIGSPKVNAGRLTEVEPGTTDFYLKANPGENTFINNGNSGVLYDLYNNGQGTIYAQGNTWNVAIQDSTSIEEVIVHQADNANLGLVIFMPARTPGAIETVETLSTPVETRYYNLAGSRSSTPFQGLNMEVTRFSDGTVRTAKVMK